jgi:uncharacterized delta-60 repeat protein
MKRFVIAWFLGVCAFASCTQSARAIPGALDTSFGQNGFAFVGFENAGLGYAEVAGVAVQSDGKLVVAGNARTTGINFSQTAMVLARFNANGTLDTSFGTGGSVVAMFDTSNTAAAIAIQPSDGKIVVAGYASGSAGTALVLARYTSAGAADSTFGNAGKATSPIGSGGRIAAMAIQGDGRIMLAGTVVRSATGADFLLVRFLASGAPDTSFGSTGLLPNLTASVTTDFGGQDHATSLAIRSDGTIVAAGQSQAFLDSYFVVARYSANGALDNTFGSFGRVATNFVASDHGGATGDAAFGVAVQSDGKIVVVGRAETNTGLATTDIALARYNANGSLDTTFGTGGKVTTAFVPTNNQVYDDAFAVVIQPDGRIVVAGYTGLAFEEVFAVARYNVNGTLDSTFGNGGKVTTDRRGIIAYGVAIQKILLEGMLVVAGEGSPPNASASRLTLARFDAFTTTLTRVGTFALDPAEADVAVHQRLNYAFTWTVPEPLNWHELQSLQLRIRDGSDVVFSATFDEASGLFSLLNEATRRSGPGVAPGSRQRLETSDAILYMADTSVRASGPTSPTVTLHLSLGFKPSTAGRTFVVEVAATDDSRIESGFVTAGTVTVEPIQ